VSTNPKPFFMKTILLTIFLPLIFSNICLSQKLASVDNSSEPVFTHTDIAAEFPGGEKVFAKYMERNLDQSVAKNAGAPAGTYTVEIEFIIDKTGDVTDPKALTHNGYGMEAEAINFLKRGPKWKPAVQNDRLVKSYFRQSFVFVVPGF
jgi:periplasmic protein TonB